MASRTRVNGRVPAKRLALDENLRKVQPKLRMIANGSEKVNALRSDQSSVVCVQSERLRKRYEPPRGPGSLLSTKDDLPTSEKRGRLQKITDSITVPVLIETVDAEDESQRKGRKRSPLPGKARRRGNVLVAELTSPDPSARFPCHTATAERVCSILASCRFTTGG